MAMSEIYIDEAALKVTEFNYLDDIRNHVDVVEERIINLENVVNSNFIDFIKYTEDRPKASDEWLEERLRALEHQVKLLLLEKVK